MKLSERVLYILCALSLESISATDCEAVSASFPNANISTNDCCSSNNNIIITCNKNNRIVSLAVVKINVSEYQVNGPLPARLVELTEIQGLTLGYASINGSVPTFLCKLKLLTVLNLFNNNMEGEIPE